MQILIDSNVEFKLSKGRTATVDARELAEFKRSLFETKGKTNPDRPEDPPTLDWSTIIAETTAYIKAHAGVDINPSEAIAIFIKADQAWEEMQKNWRRPIVALATSSDSTDPRYAD